MTCGRFSAPRSLAIGILKAIICAGDAVKMVQLDDSECVMIRELILHTANSLRGQRMNALADKLIETADKFKAV